MPGDHVEDGRLAGAVGSDQPGDRPARHDDVDVVDRDQPTEALGQPGDDEDRLGSGVGAGSLRRRRSCDLPSAHIGRLIVMRAHVEERSCCSWTVMSGSPAPARLRVACSGRARRAATPSSAPAPAPKTTIAILADVVVGQEVVADLLAKGVERSGQPLGQDAVEGPDDERADDRAVDVADAAEDDRRRGSGSRA